MLQKTSTAEALTQAKAFFGVVPNLMARLAETNPAVAVAYLSAARALRSGVLDAREQQATMLAASAFNECHYCTAAHRTAGKALGISQSDLEAIDHRRPPSDARLRTLTEATWTLMAERGWLTDARLRELGVTREETFELIALIGLKTITNYVNHIQATELDPPLRAQAQRSVPRSA